MLLVSAFLLLYMHAFLYLIIVSSFIFPPLHLAIQVAIAVYPQSNTFVDSRMIMSIEDIAMWGTARTLHVQ